jgi:hypothetical protein
MQCLANLFLFWLATYCNECQVTGRMGTSSDGHGDGNHGAHEGQLVYRQPTVLRRARRAQPPNEQHMTK